MVSAPVRFSLGTFSLPLQYSLPCFWKCGCVCSYQKLMARGWGHSSVVEYLPSMHQALGSIPSSPNQDQHPTAKQRRRKAETCPLHSLYNTVCRALDLFLCELTLLMPRAALSCSLFSLAETKAESPETLRPYLVRAGICTLWLFVSPD